MSILARYLLNEASRQRLSAESQAILEQGRKELKLLLKRKNEALRLPRSQGEKS